MRIQNGYGDDPGASAKPNANGIELGLAPVRRVTLSCRVLGPRCIPQPRPIWAIPHTVKYPAQPEGRVRNFGEMKHD
jgi:hypothetical protein